MDQPHNPFAGETPFPFAGEGAFLKFTTSDIIHLHTIYGDDPRKPVPTDPDGKVTSTFWTNILGRISVHDPHVLFNLLRTGLKERGPDGKLAPIIRDDEWWEDPPFAWADIAETLEFGVTLSRWGMTPADLAAKLRAEVEMAEGGAAEVNPQTGMTGESPTSSDS